MSRLATHADRLAPTQLVQQAQGVLHAMTANPLFPNPTPGLDEFSDAIDRACEQIQTVEALRTALRLALSQRNEALTTVRVGLNALGRYVQTVSQGRATVISSGGFALAATPRRVAMLQVSNLRVSPSDQAHELKLAWDRQKRARFYEIQVCLDDGSSPSRWADLAKSTRASCRHRQGLKSGQRVWVRVRAVGTQGAGPWSGPVCKTVP